MKSRQYIDPKEDLPKGYVQPHSEDYVPSDRDFELGFCSYGMMELDDMFGGFTQRQMGVVGGDKTVDDYSPEGVDWHTEYAGVGGARGNKSRGSGRKEAFNSSVPELRSIGDSEDEADEVMRFEEDQGGKSPRDREDYDDGDADDAHKGRGKRYP